MEKHQTKPLDDRTYAQAKCFGPIFLLVGLLLIFTDAWVLSMPTYEAILIKLLGGVIMIGGVYVASLAETEYRRRHGVQEGQQDQEP